MTIEEADLIAWLDGELPPVEADRIARAVAADPELAELAGAHRSIAERFRKGFAPLADEAVPTNLIATAKAGASNNVIGFNRRSNGPSVARRFVLPTWTALAATLVVGIVAGALVAGGSGTLVGRPSEVASGALASALDTQLASTGQDGPVKIALTFRGHDGKICRTWSNPTQAGIACRAGDSWAIKALVMTPPQEHEVYRTAAASNPQLMTIVDAMIDGNALGSAQEADARRRSWR